MTTHTPSQRLATMIHNANLPAYIKRELAEILADVRKMEATAPEMLEALRTFATWLVAPDLHADTLKDMRVITLTAIAKAEGRTL